MRRCECCGKIQWSYYFGDLRGMYWRFRKRHTKCVKCGKHGVYEKVDGKWLCWGCWSKDVDLPF